MRYILDFGEANAAASPAFVLFIDADTLAPVTPPAIVEIGSGLYYFDYTWGTSPTTIAYKASVNGVELSGVISSDGTGAVPAPPAPPPAATAQQMTLSQLRDAVRERADIQSDPHITDSELTRWINGSLAELYDLLIKHGGEDYYTAQATITTDGATDTYALPNGTLYSGAPSFYKGLLVEWNFAAGPNGWVTIPRFNLREKNRYNVPPYVGVGQSSALGRVNLRYRITGSNLLFVPLPAGGQQIRMWYAPRLTELAADADVADGVSGWLDYVVVDAARKALIKQERDPSALVLEKNDLRARIEEMSQNRDQGEPATVSETTTLDGGYGGDWNWPNLFR